MLQLKTNGKVFEGWESIKVSKGIRSLCGSYTLAVSNLIDDVEIFEGDSASIEIDGEQVIVGNVDTVDGTFTNVSSITVSGRDKTGDLVDCSAPPKQYQKIDLAKFCNLLCAPFNINVIDQTDKKTIIPIIRANVGESVFSVIEKAARQSANLVYSDSNGNLILSSAGKAGKYDRVLEQGVNIRSSSFNSSYIDVFSEITVMAQGEVSESNTKLDQHDVAARVSIGGDPAEVQKPSPKVEKKSNIRPVRVEGTAIGRYRPLIIQAEQNGTQERCRRRASWEASTRLAKSKKYKVDVKGWLAEDGKPWIVNKTIRVKSSKLRVDDYLLIEQVDFVKDSSGSITTLHLVNPEAYTELPQILTPKKQSKETASNRPKRVSIG